MDMAHAIHAGVTASVTELKRDPMGTMAAGHGAAVAILNRNQPAFYCVPADEYEAMLNMIEDAQLNAIADARANSAEIAVSLDEL
jgi:antitoxin StbD